MLITREDVVSRARAQNRVTHVEHEAYAPELQVAVEWSEIVVVKTTKDFDPSSPPSVVKVLVALEAEAFDELHLQLLSKPTFKYSGLYIGGGQDLKNAVKALIFSANRCNIVADTHRLQLEMGILEIPERDVFWRWRAEKKLQDDLISLRDDDGIITFKNGSGWALL